MATSSVSTLGLVLRQQRSQLRNDKLVQDIDRATMGLPRVSTKRLELLKQQYLDLVAVQQKNTASAVPSAAPITRHDSSSSHSSPHHSPCSPSIHGSSLPSEHKSSVTSTPKELDVQLIVDSPLANHDSPLSSPPTIPVGHSSAALPLSNQHALSSQSNQHLLSPNSSLSSSCPPPHQTSLPLPHSSSPPLLPYHSPATDKQNSPTPSKNRTSPLLPTTSAKYSKADENPSDHSSSHLLSLLGEDNSSVSSLSSPFTPDAVEKPVANLSPVLMEVDKATQEIKMEESLEEKVHVVNGQEQKLNTSPPVSNEVLGETNEEREDKKIEISLALVERSKQKEQVEEDSKSATEERKASQKKDSSSANESDSEDFWASGSSDDLPLPKEKNGKKNKGIEEECVEEEEPEMMEKKKEADEEQVDEEEMESVAVQDHFTIVQHMLHSLNDRLRKDREEAKYLYMDSSPTDGMKGLIVSSKVLTAVLTRVSGEGCEISSWDSRAVAAVLREELREMISNEGPLISEESSKQSLQSFNDGLMTPWKEVWSLLVEHARLVFQCGQSLESVASAFSLLEEGERNGVLQNLLEASCGVEQSWLANSKHDDTLTSSPASSEQNGDAGEVSESDAYRSLLLQSSLVFSGEPSSDEADSDIEQKLHKLTTSKPLSPVHHTLLLSHDQASFTKTSVQPDNDMSIASSTTSSIADVSLPEVATSKSKIISASDIAKRTTMMKRMGLLDVSESESDIELQQGLNDTTEDFDFYT